MTDPFVLYRQDGAVVTLTLDRPDSRNAIGTHQDCDDLAAAFERAQHDVSVSCIVLTGKGSSFSAGGNLKAMKERNGIGPLEAPDATRANYKRGVQRVARTMWECEVPMIAAINGHAIGLGLDLACLCDMRISADGAKFASSFIKMGIVPGDGGAWILPRAVGLAKAAEMIFTGDMLSAADALSVGLVSQVVPADQLMAAAQALAARVVANPAKALRLAKRLLREGQQQRLADVLELSAAFQALAHETQDHAEALDAFLEKRTPQFTGR
ncbi:MAG: enoyl-CoA hydratase [Hydrocarboniphaga sp.]|uniref:crotonase/enoyl-CoA hydratase family protein n=1 Tax=Hydrocarboniphaga sp. TaxID=2033016 RepID=UPI00261F7232|nr:crotonase/enoyl-CoA hydratase family protein [Hydrocarboniphaga sp.]MDB5972457.1 enoyl-CoA hydratase [Hydrocarboniphaga sp.]